jgi:hypothetical protein
VGRERAKLGYFWRHAYRIPRSGPYLGCVVNSDTGKTVILDESRLTAAEFEKVKIAETIETRGDKRCRPFHSPLWQADTDKIRRMAPIEFIGRYMPGWFDYAVCDEIEKNGIGGSADAVWKALNTQHQRLFPTTSESNNETVVDTLQVAPRAQSDAAGLTEESMAPSILIFGQRPNSLSGRKPRSKPPAPEQASLFGREQPRSETQWHSSPPIQSSVDNFHQRGRVTLADCRAFGQRPRCG